MDIEAGIENTVDELGVGLVIALLTPILCCLLPARYQWTSLSDKEKLKIVVCSSIVVGNVDYALDITVAKNWFEDGDVWWGSLICASISVSGLVSWYFRACHMDPGHLDTADFSVFNPTSSDYKLLPLFLIGLGSVYDAIVVVLSGFDDDRTFKFQSTRLMEIMLESLPSGSLQIYVSVLRNDWNKWLETASIIASLLSVAWGLMTSTSHAIYNGVFRTSAPKWSILCFCLCDFIANTLPLAMFISLRPIRAISIYIFFSVTFFINIIRRFIEQDKQKFFYDGLIDGIVWLLLATFSSARLVINLNDSRDWSFMSAYHKSLLLRFVANVSFFLIAVFIDIANDIESFSTQFPYYIGVFVLVHLILLVSIFTLTDSFR